MAPRKPRKKASKSRQASRKRRPGNASPTRRKPARGSKGGKPKIVFNLRQLTRMAREGCSHDTMAAIMDVSRSVLQVAIAEDSKVARALEVGRARMCRSLHQAQFRSATGGNVTMQIWLGKNDLGQRDVKAIEVSGADGGPIDLTADLRPILEEKLARLIQSRAAE